MNLTINKHLIEVEELPTTITGLTYLPQMKNYNNNADWEVFSINYGFETVPENIELHTKIIKQVSGLKGAIVEIGVGGGSMRSLTGSFTENFLAKKPKDTIYLGIDNGDRTFLDNTENNVFTIKADSTEQEKIRAYMKTIGIDKIALLHIDGDHSVNVVTNDWLYTDLLEDKGVVIFHDTNVHPGPPVFLPAIDKTKYRVEKYFENKKDWGIAAAFKL